MLMELVDALVYVYKVSALANSVQFHSQVDVSKVQRIALFWRKLNDVPTMFSLTKFWFDTYY